MKLIREQRYENLKLRPNEKGVKYANFTIIVIIIKCKRTQKVQKAITAR